MLCFQFIICCWFCGGDNVPQGQNFIPLPFVQALIWSKMSTGLPIEILSSMKSQSYTSFCRLDIDINKYGIHIFDLQSGILLDLSWLMVFQYMDFQEYSSHPCAWKKRKQGKVAWSWNPDSNWGELDNVPCKIQEIDSDWKLRLLLIAMAPFVYEFLFVSAVENTALHAANGCHYTICTISFQVSFRNSRVHALSLFLKPLPSFLIVISS